MKTVITLMLAVVGGVLAFTIGMPIPWLMGSLLIILLFYRFSFLKAPPSAFATWVRIFFGFSLGAPLSHSFDNVAPFLVITVGASLCCVLLMTLFGFFYFRRLKNFSDLDAFMSALPGGITFLISLSDKLAKSFPKIGLIHTVRMVFMLSVITLFAVFIDSGANTENATFLSAFSFHYDSGLWLVFLLTLFSGVVSKRLNIAGGDIIFPMIISACCYGFGFIHTPMPEVIITISMITFGAVLGCKIIQSVIVDFQAQVKASISFTVIIMSMAMFFAVLLGFNFDEYYFLFFLALAPGSIPEICAIALIMGLDVGFIALIHTCRYLFIMFIGALGFQLLDYWQKKNHKMFEL